MRRGGFKRGDIIHLTFDPALGSEQQGHRPALVLTPEPLNRLGLVGVCPITQGGNAARQLGMAVSLMGCGTQTQGVVLVHQFRMLDPKLRRAQWVEAAPEHVTEECRARVAAMLD